MLLVYNKNVRLFREAIKKKVPKLGHCPTSAEPPAELGMPYLVKKSHR
jgi:hypothetical protein